MLSESSRAAAAFYEGLYFRKLARLSIYLQNSRAKVATWKAYFSFFSWSRPKRRKYLPRKWIAETSPKSKSSDYITYSSKLIKCCFSMVVAPFSLSRCVIRFREGDIGSPSFAAIKRHVTAKVARHGACYSSNPSYTRFFRCLSAILTARYSVSSRYYFMVCNFSISSIICSRFEFFIFILFSGSEV